MSPHTRTPTMMAANQVYCQNEMIEADLFEAPSGIATRLHSPFDFSEQALRARRAGAARAHRPTLRVRLGSCRPTEKAFLFNTTVTRNPTTAPPAPTFRAPSIAPRVIAWRRSLRTCLPALLMRRPAGCPVG